MKSVRKHQVPGDQINEIWYVNLILLGRRAHIPFPTTDYIFKICSHRNDHPGAGSSVTTAVFLPVHYMSNRGTKGLSALLSASAIVY